MQKKNEESELECSEETLKEINEARIELKEGQVMSTKQLKKSLGI